MKFMNKTIRNCLITTAMYIIACLVMRAIDAEKQAYYILTGAWAVVTFLIAMYNTFEP